MDAVSSLIAALDAGKLPNQQQLNAIIDWVLVNIIPADSPEFDEFSQPGRVIARSLTEVLTAYKQLGTSKNHDNLVQDTLWHLSEGDLSATRVEVIDAEEVSADMNTLYAALKDLLQILWADTRDEGSQLLGNLTSFTRLALADLAEAVQAQLAHTKQSLRASESEVQSGERDSLGRKHETPQEEREETDPQAKFEKTMDTVKEVGSRAIETGQSVKAITGEKVSGVRQQLIEAFYQIGDRAQNSEKFKRTLSTLFIIASKWLNRTLDTAAATDELMSLDTFIDDPTEANHVHHAITNLRMLCERLAGGRSLDELFAKLRACVLGIRRDQDVQAWFDDLMTHMRRTLLETPGSAHGQEAQEKYEQLVRRWKELVGNHADVAREWKTDLDVLHHELQEFQQAIADDADLRRAREAHARLVRDVEKSVVSGGGLGLQSALEHGTWFWQDLFNVYMRRILRMLKSIPIPRIEYVDHEVEFVLENLDISSFNLLPGHAYMRNITDIELTAPGVARAPMERKFGTMTHIRLQAMQLSLRDVSFFYKDKTSTIGPNEFTGVIQFNLPTQGLDLDFKFRLIPSTKEGLAEREQTKRFFKIERVNVKLADDIKLTVKDSNHRIIASVFKPVLVHRFREAIERTLEEHVRGAFDFADATAFDFSKRTEVFADAGLGPTASLTAAIWSEIGHFKKQEGGVLTGWKATRTGIIKEGREGEPTIAMGAEPQILPGEKHGPLESGSEPLAEQSGVPLVAERAKEVGREGMKRVQSFRETVRCKVAEEKGRVGWESTAFDVL